MKYINFKRFKFPTIFKKINFPRYNFSKLFKFIEIGMSNFKNAYKYVHFDKSSFLKLFKIIGIKIYNFSRINKINFRNSNFLLFHLPAAIVFFTFLYIAIPTLYNYDKSSFQNIICKKNNFECLIQGKVNYKFYPTPRIKLSNVVINEIFEKKKRTLAKADNIIIKLSIKNLLAKEKHKYKKIELKNFQVNIELKNSKKYKNIFTDINNFYPVDFNKGKIILFNDNDYVSTINDVNLNLLFKEKSKEMELNGKFLNDNIYFSLQNKKIDNRTSSDIILKMSNMNILTKANFLHPTKKENELTGNVFIKKDKNRFAGFASYKDNKIIIKKSNIKNTFSDGQVEGEIEISPYFNFDIDIDLSSINFTKLCNYFLALDKKNQKNLFNLNKKINGKLNISSEKVYSSNNLAKSFESQIVFTNGGILVERFLVNLGKLGAADITGKINNEKNTSNFKYESNVYVDNQKKFISKFGIYKKKKIPSNLFISGNFDFRNVRSSFYEISHNDKLNTEDLNFIEQEFNDLMLSNDYDDLFDFRKLKVFIKSITSE